MNSFWLVTVWFVVGGLMLAAGGSGMPLISIAFVLWLLLKFHNRAEGSGERTMPTYEEYKQSRHTRR